MTDRIIMKQKHNQVKFQVVNEENKKWLVLDLNTVFKIRPDTLHRRPRFKINTNCHNTSAIKII